MRLARDGGGDRGRCLRRVETHIRKDDGALGRHAVPLALPRILYSPFGGLGSEGFIDFLLKTKLSSSSAGGGSGTLSGNESKPGAKPAARAGSTYFAKKTRLDSSNWARNPRASCLVSMGMRLPPRWRPVAISRLRSSLLSLCRESLSASSTHMVSKDSDSLEERLSEVWSGARPIAARTSLTMSPPASLSRSKTRQVSAWRPNSPAHRSHTALWSK